MGQPPLCIDCDREIPFERYQLGLCPECMEERLRLNPEFRYDGPPFPPMPPGKWEPIKEERAMNDPNWHRSTEDWDELPPETFCRCGHKLADHWPTDLAPCQTCDCEEFDVEPTAESLRSANRGD